jgi:hypothetical protein
MDRIREAQKGDKEIDKIIDALKEGKANGFSEMSKELSDSRSVFVFPMILILEG